MERCRRRRSRFDRATFARLATALAGAAAVALAGCTAESAAVGPGPAPPSPSTSPVDQADKDPASKPERFEPFLDDLEARTFRFFWDQAEPGTGLMRDRYPKRTFASIAAVAFALTAYPIGVERGYVSRAAARERVLTTLRFLYNAPQGPDERGMTGYKGFFYHFLDFDTGARHGRVELSTVDTALLLGGALFCQSYFDDGHPEEVEIRDLVDQIYRRVDWRWARARPPMVSMGWKPEQGFLPLDWRGYNEAMLVYFLALASPTFPVDPEAWEAWTRSYEWKTVYGQEHIPFPPHFGHQYSHIWVDFRGIEDAYMRGRGIDYFENSRRATYAQRAYAIANPRGWKGYSDNVWGLTACDGPLFMELEYAGEKRRFEAYYARGLATGDDGTIAPTAAAASIPFAPEIAVPAVLEMYRRYGRHIYSTYGFLDSFNPSFRYDVPVQHGRVIPDFGWVASDYLSIDQGPILAMIENYRSELVWRVMRRNRWLRLGLERAGFQGGWLDKE